MAPKRWVVILWLTAKMAWQQFIGNACFRRVIGGYGPGTVRVLSEKNAESPYMWKKMQKKKNNRRKYTDKQLLRQLQGHEGDANYLRRVFGVGADRQRRLLRLNDARKRASKLFRAPEEPLKVPSRPMSLAEWQVYLIVSVKPFYIHYFTKNYYV